MPILNMIYWATWWGGWGDRPDIDSFSLTTTVASWQSRLHAVGISGDWSNIYIGKDTSNLSQHTATDWNLANYSSSIVSSISYQSRWLRCKPDGTMLFDSHDNGNIYQVNMSTPYSLSWSTVNTYATGSKCCGISLSHDGTKLYHWVWDSPKTFYEYTLSTPRDVNSRWPAISHTVDVIQSTSWDWPNIYQTQISPTWKKMYFYADQWMIYQYNLSTPYDWGTATYHGSLNVWFGARGSFQFTEDWKRIILWNLSNKQLYQYDAS